MSEKNILIPKSRYDKLVARMTQPVKNPTPSPGNRNEDHTGIYLAMTIALINQEVSHLVKPLQKHPIRQKNH